MALPIKVAKHQLSFEKSGRLNSRWFPGSTILIRKRDKDCLKPAQNDIHASSPFIH
jgi:hypothetical protein